MFIIYENDNETIITTPKQEEKTLMDLFFKGSGRKVEDYKRTEYIDDHVVIFQNT